MKQASDNGISLTIFKSFAPHFRSSER